MVMEGELTTTEAEDMIAKRYHETGDYQGMYEEHGRLAKLVWDNKKRRDYEADYWYNMNRNDICLEMLGDLCKDKRVLSIGGGQWMEKELLKSIDAREIVRTDIAGSLEEGVQTMDAENLLLPDASFDVVICRELIEHVISEQNVFDEIKRVLVPEGYLLITTPNAYTLAVDGVFHVRGYTPKSFLVELYEQGFKVVKKRGNVPYILNNLLILAGMGFKNVVEEFRDLDLMTRHLEERYYLSSQLFVLCRKKVVEGS